MITKKEDPCMSEIDILMVYPRLGSQDTVLRDIPLILLYAAAHSVKNGFRVKILDCRLRTRLSIEVALAPPLTRAVVAKVYVAEVSRR